jgi:hypothetical protein
MLFRIFIPVLAAILLLSDPVYAQQTPPKKDTITIYKNIETYSKRSKFNGFMYSLIFKPVTAKPKKKDIQRKGFSQPVQKAYSTFENKIIRKIEILTLDPFGYSATDPTVPKKNFLYRAGNGMHIKTQGLAIRNLLLIRKNTPFNSLLVKESERLVRLQNYVQDVSFFVQISSPGSDSVDIFIREKDKWSLIPYLAVSNSGMRISATDRNIGGTGHEFRTSYSKDFDDGLNFFSSYYSIPNIRNTYIRTTLRYEKNSAGNFRRGISAERPFYSPYAKWAAGIALLSVADKDTIEYVNSVYSPQNLKFNIQDFWAGKAFQIFKGVTENERATNLIISSRYLRIRYSEKPAELYDPLSVYSDEDFYLASVGISTRKYVQDKFIFKYGFVEDVPVGSVYAITGGYQLRNGSNRLYLGTRASFGNYSRWGYLGTNLEYGTFFHEAKAEQGVFIGEINYFSELLEAGRWKFRQFIKPQVTIGINRFSYDSLTLNDGYGVDGFHSPSLSGNKRLTVTFQTQSYSPLNLAGFRFGPYINYTFGMLADIKGRFMDSKIYSQISLGVLIKNQNLVFATFQISLSYYPQIPGVGENIFRMNSIRTTDFGYRDFNQGKPSPVLYQ